MAKILEMPKLSPTMEEGVLSAWHKKEGDAIAVDDLLAEVETDKATMEFRAFDKGTLLRVLVAAGANVKLGQPVAILGEAGEDVSALYAQVGGGAGAPAAAPAAAAPAAAAAKAPAAPAATAPSAASATPSSGAAAAAAASTTVVAGTAPRESPRTAASLSAETMAPPAVRRPPIVNPLDRTSYAPETPIAVRPAPGGAAAAGAGLAPADGARVLASPYVRKVARERGIDLAAARGSGPGGRIVPADLDAAPAPVTAAATLVKASPSSTMTSPTVLARAPSPDEPEVRPLSPMRKTIARRLTESKTTVPHFYLTIDVDAAALVKLREQINRELAGGDGGAGGGGGNAKADGHGDAGAAPLKVSLNDLLVKACAVALVRVPECNASFTPEAILVHHRVDISVAVAIPDGLVTPVLRHADQKSVVAIAREVRELASRARARKLKPEEMTDGTFSISNLGMFGIDGFSAVINPPEGAILAVGQVRDVPVVAGDAIVPGKRLAMTLSCDHRVVDGAVGAAFLAELRRLVEHPLRVLTG